MQMKPTYSFRPASSLCDSVVVIVTPPAWTGFGPQEVTLTRLQFEHFQSWRDCGGLIQRYLPELTPGQRELLLSGIPEEEFDSMFSEED